MAAGGGGERQVCALSVSRLECAVGECAVEGRFQESQCRDRGAGERLECAVGSLSGSQGSDRGAGERCESCVVHGGMAGAVGVGLEHHDTS